MAAARGMVVRLHVVFAVFIGVRVIQSVQPGEAGLVFQVAGLVGLLALVLLHEFGHVLAARRLGVEHTRLVLWPLGGLDHGDQPERPSQMAGVAVAGPLVSLLLLLPLAGLTWLTTGSLELVAFDLFAYREAAVAASAEGLLAWLIWSLYASNLMLLGFNALVLMHPFDAGRLLQAGLWKWKGESAAAHGAGVVGMVSAAVLAAIGLVTNETVLLGIAIVGAFVSWQEISRARFLDTVDDDWMVNADHADVEHEEDVPARPDDAEVDRILAKISETGLESLSLDERQALDQASAADRDI